MKEINLYLEFLYMILIKKNKIFDYPTFLGIYFWKHFNDEWDNKIEFYLILMKIEDKKNWFLKFFYGLII